MIFASTMKDLFGRDHEEKRRKYYQTGRKFWHLNGKWELWTITYIRSGVMFYTIDNSTEEHWCSINSVAAYMLHPKTIFLSELPYNVPKNIPFDTFNGAITINVK